MATSEIEKLERRYTENPHGLTFAPLAEVHRKNGDVARALELLTAGLELHPNYIPASIVLGRCHQDLGDLPAAEAAFAQVLKLDDENVIALKSLADIGERLERYADAEAWLQRLVSVDRSNDEAREQLLRVEAARTSATTASAPSAGNEIEMLDVARAEATAADQPSEVFVDPLPADISALATNPGATDVPEEMTAPPADRTEAVALEITMPGPAEDAEVTDARDVAGVTSGEPEAFEEEPDEFQSASRELAEEPGEPLSGLISAEFKPPLQSTGGLGVETSEDLVLDASGNSEFRVPDASEDLKSVAARLSMPADVVPTREETWETQPALAPIRPPEPEFVFTENMAELLVQQGHSDDALRVYRELARRQGPDARLEARIADLEAAAAHPSPRRSYLARDTQGQTVGSFFHALLLARPQAEPGFSGSERVPRTEAAPGSSGQNGAAFSGGYGEESLPIPPAVPSGEQTADAAVSFDTFFRAEPDASAPVEQTEAEPGQKDDLDQFQSWLQNLKR